jgi:hypothetical protein
MKNAFRIDIWVPFFTFTLLPIAWKSYQRKKLYHMATRSRALGDLGITKPCHLHYPLREMFVLLPAEKQEAVL